MGDCLVRSGSVRYATAERFGRPLPVAVADTRPASRQISPQPRSRLEAVMGPQEERPMGEDCLNLSVVTPARDGARPVVVFLHGGAFSSGSGLLDWYDGGLLAAQGDVVVVSVSYRLGVLGFLWLDGVSEGNLGLFDQIEALRWVRRNIGDWGGDPDDVTVMGQSAGGVSIRLLIESPDARGLFGRAIVQSAPPHGVVRSRAQAVEIGELFASVLDEDPTTADIAAILAAQRQTTVEHVRRGARPIPLPFWPVADAAPVEASRSPEQLDLDVFYGWNADDDSAFFPDADGPAESTRLKYDDAMAQYAKQLRARGARTHGYRLDWRPPGSPFGATHCLELPLLLGSEGAWTECPMLGDLGWPEVLRLGEPVRDVWLRFVRTGDPGPLPSLLVTLH